MAGSATIMWLKYYDADAQLFITAAGITDANQKEAIDVLVRSAKANGWWSLCLAIYPMIGGTSTTCKYNLKDPRDLDAAFRLSFANSPTITTNGVAWNGTTQFANTFLTPSTSLALGSGHLSYYSRTANAAGAFGEMGSADGTGAENTILAKFSDGLFYPVYTDNSGGLPTTTPASSAGFFMVNRTGTVNAEGYYNNTQVTNGAEPSGLSTISIYLGAEHNVVTNVYTNRECAFATIGSGLTSGQALSMYTDIQAFQAKLGRQV